MEEVWNGLQCLLDGVARAVDDGRLERERRKEGERERLDIKACLMHSRAHNHDGMHVFQGYVRYHNQSGALSMRLL